MGAMEGQSRRVRVTLRCCREDLGRPVPDLGVEMVPDHPVVREVRRIRDSAPEGLRRIASIASPPVFKVRVSRWRGAVWIDEGLGIVWLLATSWREEGSRSDAYEVFERLHRDGRLLPDDADHLRDRAETAARFLRELPAQVESSLAFARKHPDRDLEGNLGETIPIRLCVEREPALDALWLAVCGQDVYGDHLRPELRNVIFATYERYAGPGEWEPVYVWRDGRSLQRYECARFGLTENV